MTLSIMIQTYPFSSSSSAFFPCGSGAVVWNGFATSVSIRGTDVFSGESSLISAKDINV